MQFLSRTGTSEPARGRQGVERGENPALPRRDVMQPQISTWGLPAALLGFSWPRSEP